MDAKDKLAEKAVNIGDKLLDKIVEYAGQTEAFVKDQVPDYIQQLLEFEFMWGVVAMSAALFFFLWGVFIVIVCMFGDKKINDEACSFALLYTLGSTALLIICVLSYGKDVVKIKYAPKVYIMDYVKDLRN